MKRLSFLIAFAFLSSLNAKVCVVNNPPWLESMRNSNSLEVGSQWQVTDGTNIVSGMARCSVTSGTIGVAGNPSTSVGSYCWYKMTSPAFGDWVFCDAALSWMDCDTHCSMYCTRFFQAIPEFRAAVLTPK